MKLINTFNNNLSTRNNLVNSLWGGDFFMEPDKFFGNQSTSPKVNITENEEQFNIEVAAPGYEKSEFKIELENNLLTIAVERDSAEEQAKNKYSLCEFNYSSFSRSFRLPKGKIKDNEISAEYNNGILTVNLPKAEEAKPQPKRMVEIA